MEKVQDIVIQSVQEYLSSILRKRLSDAEVDAINETIEMKILSSFYEMGIPSPIR
jgi:hypothetical protein